MISSTFFGSKAYPYFFCPPEKVTKKNSQRAHALENSALVR